MYKAIAIAALVFIGCYAISGFGERRSGFSAEFGSLCIAAATFLYLI